MTVMMPVVCMGTNEVVEGPWRGPSLSHNYQVIITSITKYYKVLQSITKYYKVLQSVTKYYKVLQRQI